MSDKKLKAPTIAKELNNLNDDKTEVLANDVKATRHKIRGDHNTSKMSLKYD